jgi:hypothetical protein
VIWYRSVGVVGGRNQRWSRAGYEEVEGVARVMSRESNMLGKVESVKQVRKRRNMGSRGIINVEVKVAGEDEFGWGWNKIFKERSKFRYEGRFGRGWGSIYIE